ncbi:hypothetical protein AMEX_G25205 [Astyanax mexicanus]|uniref:Immunoglobulin subtype domain-containing protein n=1 Tax=Astyanax mexicanus TaxID=7994 RepID=A0A8T2KXY8_ASTMX|nr:hypothetical protein AMEX_G25205 [Astyanax mexicanus]
MEFCRSALWVLILLIISSGSESAAPVVKVEYNGTAVLPCIERCSGVASWTLTHKSTDILAECDQTSCRSLKEGYQMIHDKYLKGDFSLIITEADYSKKGHYTCDCDDTDKCDAELQIEALRTSVQIKPGDTLVMDVDESVPVEVIYQCTREAGTSNVQICRVIGKLLQPSAEYTNRTSLSSSALELRGVNVSDSGDYIIRDTRNNGDIHIYTVEVTGDSKQPQIQEKEETPISDAQESMKIVSLVVFSVGALIVAVVGVVLLFKKNMLCFKKSAKLSTFTYKVDSCNEQNIYSPEKSPLNHQQV